MSVKKEERKVKISGNIKKSYKKRRGVRQHKAYRNHKDRVFRLLLSDKENLLEIYNSLNGTQYKDASQLTITTLDNAIYIKMKNDISFLIGHHMNLYEHQSTFNPNMPLRGLFYLVDLYKIYIKDEDLLGSHLITVPTPHYIVFYNGTKEQADEMVLRLSDAYEDKKMDSCLELEVKMLNINLGHNQALLEKCKCLHGYAVYVDRVRQYAKEDKLEQAVDKAIEECLEEEGIGEFLKKQKAEVKNMTLYEFDEEMFNKLRYKEGFEDGENIGIQQGIKQGEEYGQERVNQLIRMLSEKNRIEDITRAARDREYQEKLFDEFEI